MFKPHHLELFYHVARSGGISAASRHMPYSLGQPAISGQISDFERQLERKLFERKPFQLTEAGRQLYAYIRPFYDGLGPLWQQLRSGPAHRLCLAADDPLGPEFFPAVIAAIAPPQPHIGFELRTGPPSALERWLHERQVQLVITATDRRPAGIRSLTLARPGLRLLVRRRARILSPGHFWRQRRITEPLICPVEAGAVHRTFERGLRALRVDWPVAIRTDSNAVMLQLVAGGHGVGVGLELPDLAQHPEIHPIPLTKFDPVTLVALWRPPVGPGLESLLAAVRTTARKWWQSEEGIFNH